MRLVRGLRSALARISERRSLSHVPVLREVAAALPSSGLVALRLRRLAEG